MDVGYIRCQWMSSSRCLKSTNGTHNAACFALNSCSDLDVDIDYALKLNSDLDLDFYMRLQFVFEGVFRFGFTFLIQT